MTRMDRRALFATGAAAALLAATGVSAAPRRGGRLRAALSGASRTDGWDVTGGRFMQAAGSAVFEGLTEIAADGTVRGELAEDWASTDGVHWTFSLRETEFHDGVALTEGDISMSLAPLGEARFTKGKLELRLDTVDQNLPYRLAGPEFLIKPADAARRAEGIGTGLYALHKFDAGRHFIAERVETHWKDGQAGWFDSVEFVHFDDPGVRAQALVEGLVDVADVTEIDGPIEGFQRLPDPGVVAQIASRAIAVPTVVGRAMPLDNLRMAERWWMS